MHRFNKIQHKELFPCSAQSSNFTSSYSISISLTQKKCIAKHYNMLILSINLLLERLFYQTNIHTLPLIHFISFSFRSQPYYVAHLTAVVCCQQRIRIRCAVLHFRDLRTSSHVVGSLISAKTNAEKQKICWDEVLLP